MGIPRPPRTSRNRSARPHIVRTSRPGRLTENRTVASGAVLLVSPWPNHDARKELVKRCRYLGIYPVPLDDWGAWYRVNGPADSLLTLLRAEFRGKPLLRDSQYDCPTRVGMVGTGSGAEVRRVVRADEAVCRQPIPCEEPLPIAGRVISGPSAKPAKVKPPRQRTKLEKTLDHRGLGVLRDNSPPDVLRPKWLEAFEQDWANAIG